MKTKESKVKAKSTAETPSVTSSRMTIASIAAIAKSLEKELESLNGKIQSMEEEINDSYAQKLFEKHECEIGKWSVFLMSVTTSFSVAMLAKLIFG